MNYFVFDIETVPDTESGAQLLGLNDLSERSIADAMLSQAKASSGQAFVKHHLQKIVAISVLLRQGDQIKLWSLGDPFAEEPEIIQRFFNGIEKLTPTLVSWNGSGFDLPVLHYRALKYGIKASTYWDNGHKENDFKFNNYLSRYHNRHIDLMDVLSGYQPKAFARLDDIAQMLGLPGKLGMHGSEVHQAYLDGEIEQIRNYCEGDVLNTYLIFLQFQKMRGMLTQEAFDKEIQLAKDMLLQSTQPHLQEFLQAWCYNPAAGLR
jgi:predicted PolB exonuclease-like 3'-5' exonuclease